MGEGIIQFVWKILLRALPFWIYIEGIIEDQHVGEMENDGFY